MSHSKSMEIREMNEKLFTTKPSIPPIEEYFEEIRTIWKDVLLTNAGPKHEVFSEKLKKFFDVKALSLFVNGHLALEIGLQALQLKGEIITTPFTFVSTTAAIVRAGCKPIFCDIKESDYTIDENKIEELITKDTVAILPVHVYGNICNHKAIDRIAKKYNLKVIYDAAHAFGEKVSGCDVGLLGDMSMFSFHATKVFNTIEGGCLVSNNETLLKCERIKNFGLVDGSAEFFGTNGKMNEFQAAMGICSLNHFSTWVERRKKLVEKYDEMLQDKGIVINRRLQEVEYNYSYYPVVFDKETFGLDRDQVTEKLNEANIFPRKYFYPLISEMKAYKEFNNDNTPIAKKISENVLTLPLYSDLSMENVQRICETILRR